MESGSSTVTAYFVTERTIETMSTSWTPSIRTPVSRFRSARFTCPERTSIGTESSHADATPVREFVPPGPLVTMSTERSFDTLAYASASIAAACS